ncbi:GNAT family N-acetyltransferase [Shewanella sp. C32]|uniref:GNAT family N-acetyltransferase n=1 Tax=Shewanella electrica TaxID=515560 RepID=A0ABT2FIG0_9GAMM|nr:N-acetyltransferase [Shewanella electrica]MCH1923878.1 GNAT family N-acetyltransferase [Shewanella electrica]MCS4555782.1 GNAT family N-acetyltransferase [Shewanella electrica]
MLIRKATPQDLADIVAFNQAMAFETEGLELDGAVLQRGVQTLLAQPSRGFYLVAEQDGNIAASLMVTFEWSDWRAKDYYWIQSVYVQPAFRRQGLYRALYQHVKQLALEKGSAASFRLYVEQDNLVAQSTYQALGMEQSHYLMFEEKVK